MLWKVRDRKKINPSEQTLFGHFSFCHSSCDRLNSSSIHPSSIVAHPAQGGRGLEPLPADTGWEVGGGQTLDRRPVHHNTNITETCNHIHTPIKVTNSPNSKCPRTVGGGQRSRERTEQFFDHRHPERQLKGVLFPSRLSEQRWIVTCPGAQRMLTLLCSLIMPASANLVKATAVQDWLSCHIRSDDYYLSPTLQTRWLLYKLTQDYQGKSGLTSCDDLKWS